MAINLTSPTLELGTPPLAQATSIQTSSEQAPSAQMQPRIIRSDEALIHHPEMLVLLGLITLGLFFVKVLGVLRVETPARETAPATPCPSCHFFSSNPYLKCAVHPADVLTHQAVHCSDYCPRSKERLPRSIAGSKR